MKRLPTVAAAVTAAAILLSGGPAMAAVGAKNPPSAGSGINGLAQVVENATPSHLRGANQRAAANAKGAFSKSGEVSVELPKNAQALVSATRSTDKGNVTVSVGTGAAQASEGQLAADGSVVYDTSSSSAHSVQPMTDGVRINTVLKDASAGTEVVHPVSLPAGAKLVAERDMPGAGELPEITAASGAVYIVGAEGNLIGGFASPWAKDAKGAPVPTHYEIKDTGLVQVIDHRSADIAYPVVADPYLGIGLIDHAV